MHASDILMLSQADPREALKNRVEKLFSERCPEIVVRNYTIPTKHFDSSYASGAGILNILNNKKTNSCLADLHGKDTFINATAINIERLFKNKLGEGSDIRKITDDYSIVEILQETSKLNIKIAFSVHEYNNEILPNGRKNFDSDQIIMLHSTTAEKLDDGMIIKNKPMFMTQKLIAYCHVKGLIDDKDISENRLNIGVHARPIDYFIKEYKKKGIEKFSFLPEKVLELQLA